MTDALDSFVAGLPKVETHLHLDGALSPSVLRELAVRQGYAPLKDKSVAEIAALSVVDKPRGSLAEVLRAFGVVAPLLKTPDAVETMAYEAVRRAARDNVKHLEARFAPCLHAGPGFGMGRILECALKGLARAETDFGVTSGVIVCLLRPYAFVSRAKNEEMLDLALAFKSRGVVGLDLAGDEAAQPLSDYADLFAKAKAAGLKLTAHAGETPESPDIETALSLGIDRLGHAIFLHRRPALLKEVAARRVPIELNLTSNLRTGAIPSYAEHPVKIWSTAGIPFTPSTDDPGLFAIDLDGEYRRLADLGFAAEELRAVARGGVEASFAPERRKGELRAAFAA